jgi:phage gp36-like protein
MYCTIEDLLKDIDKNLLIDLVNDENRSYLSVDLSQPDDICSARLNGQISAAGIEIDGYIASRYIIPFDETPARLTQIAKDITIYNCYKRRHRLDMPDSIVSIYKSRVEELKGIQKGTISLGLPGKSEEMSSEVKVNKRPEDREFGKDLLSGY